MGVNKMATATTRLRAVLFDWDGTLLDSYASDEKAYLRMFGELKLEWGLEELRRNYSPNWHHVYRAAGLPRNRWAEADAAWRKAYQGEFPKLIPGARKAIRSVARYCRVAIVSSGSGWRVREQIVTHGLAGQFAACVCSEDAPRRKPHPAPLQTALRCLRLPAESCAYVGDAPEDMEMAHRAGVEAIGVLGPSPTRHTVAMALPAVLLDSIEALSEWIFREQEKQLARGGIKKSGHFERAL
jgi:phosphoglycolate phosphatase